jgi:hypothetical protein
MSSGWSSRALVIGTAFIASPSKPSNAQEDYMKLRHTLIAAALGSLFASVAMAQTTGSEIQRDINQQERIEQGLQSGQLTTREAGRLEREEAHVDRMEARALKDNNLSPAEKARIQAAQNRVSQDIYREKHDGQVGNPNSASSQRMQADVQRNVNQERRIEQGVRSGELNNRQVGRLERGQAHDDRLQANAARDGHVGPHEQQHIQTAENRQSRHIYNVKHD